MVDEEHEETELQDVDEDVFNVDRGVDVVSEKETRQRRRFRGQGEVAK